MKRTFLLIVAGILTLVACAGQGAREQSGMVIGGTLGGLLGAQADRRMAPVAIVAGALAGAALGGAIGKSMDDTDRLKAAQSLETVRTGVPSTWRNPDTNVDYQFTPTRTYNTAAGPCREYTMDAIIGGKKETVYGTACRQADGSWKIQS